MIQWKELIVLVFGRGLFNQEILENIEGSRHQHPGNIFPINYSRFIFPLLFLQICPIYFLFVQDISFGMFTWLLFRKRGERFFLPTLNGPTHWEGNTWLALSIKPWLRCEALRSFVAPGIRKSSLLGVFPCSPFQRQCWTWSWQRSQTNSQSWTLGI